MPDTEMMGLDKRIKKFRSQHTYLIYSCLKAIVQTWIYPQKENWPNLNFQRNQVG